MNLRNKIYSHRFALNQLVEELFTKAKNDAYQLSMPLLTSSMQGDEKRYQRILPKMLAALQHFPADKIAFKAWLMGRVLLAANTIGDKKTFSQTQHNLIALLNDKSMPQNEFSAWALGYLAGASNELYSQYKDKMLEASKNLAQKYQQQKDDKSPATILQDCSTNAVWGWVMCLLASANAGDKTSYEFILKQMMVMTGQNNLADAIQKGLAAGDYPAWALSIVYVSATKIGDIALSKDLEKVIPASLQIAKQSENKNEFMLAQINTIFAESFRSASNPAVIPQLK